MTGGRSRIPRWMAALNGVILVILAAKTWVCLVDPPLLFDGSGGSAAAQVGPLRELAGRNLAMIALGLLAFLRPSPAVYVAVFTVALARETVDMAIAASGAVAGGGSPLRAAAFLPFILLYLLAIRRLIALERGPYSKGIPHE